MKNIVFGPIISRRFGVSLGVDLSPQKKQCNFDCVYCELSGAKSVAKYDEILPLDELISSVKAALEKNPKIDVLTITANGEPTLYPHLREFMIAIKPYIPQNTKSLILSNGSTFGDIRTQEALLEFDIVKFSLDSANVRSFKKVDRPHKSLDLEGIKEGIRAFARRISLTNNSPHTHSALGNHSVVNSPLGNLCGSEPFVSLQRTASPLHSPKRDFQAKFPRKASQPTNLIQDARIPQSNLSHSHTAKQGKAEVSSVNDGSLDSKIEAKSEILESSENLNSLSLRGEAEAIHNNTDSKDSKNLDFHLDCHDSAFAESRNDKITESIFERSEDSARSAINATLSQTLKSVVGGEGESCERGRGERLRNSSPLSLSQSKTMSGEATHQDEMNRNKVAEQSKNSESEVERKIDSSGLLRLESLAMTESRNDKNLDFVQDSTKPKKNQDSTNKPQKKPLLICEILLVKGINDDEASLVPLASFLREIEVDRIDLGSIDRPPAYRVEGVSYERILELSKIFSGLFVSIPQRKVGEVPSPLELPKSEIVELIKRRPLGIDEVSVVFSQRSRANLDLLLESGEICKKTIGLVGFYTAKATK